MHGTEVLQQPVRSHNPAHLQPGEEEEDDESLGTCSGSPFCACAGFTVFSRQNFMKQLWYFHTLKAECGCSVPSAVLWQRDRDGDRDTMRCHMGYSPSIQWH